MFLEKPFMVSGLQLVKDRRQDAKQDFYNEQYREADRIHILGIACRDFCQALHSPFLSRDGQIRDLLLGGGATPGSVTKNALFSALLGKPLKVEVLMVNPLSSYAKNRETEENNTSLRRDVWDSIREIRHVSERLAKEPVSISGGLDIFLLSGSPYVSLFHSIFDRAGLDKMYLSLFLSGMRGSDSPMFYAASENHLNAFCDNISRHFQSLKDKCRPLFRWADNHVSFYDPYDAVCSYPTNVLTDVKAIDRELHEKFHKNLWVSDLASQPGDGWYERFEDSLKEIGRAVVVVNKKEGPGQRSEIDLLMKSQVRTVPIFLPGTYGSTPPDKWDTAHWKWLMGLDGRIRAKFSKGEVTAETLEEVRQKLEQS